MLSLRRFTSAIFGGVVVASFDKRQPEDPSQVSGSAEGQLILPRHWQRWERVRLVCELFPQRVAYYHGKGESVAPLLYLFDLHGEDEKPIEMQRIEQVSPYRALIRLFKELSLPVESIFTKGVGHSLALNLRKFDINNLAASSRSLQRLAEIGLNPAFADNVTQQRPASQPKRRRGRSSENSLSQRFPPPAGSSWEGPDTKVESPLVARPPSKASTESVLAVDFLARIHRAHQRCDRRVELGEVSRGVLSARVMKSERISDRAVRNDYRIALRELEDRGITLETKEVFESDGKSVAKIFLFAIIRPTKHEWKRRISQGPHS